MGTLYLSAFGKVEGSLRAVPVETFVVLHAIKSLDLQSGVSSIQIVLVESNGSQSSSVPVDVDIFSHISLGKSRFPLFVKLAHGLGYFLLLFSFS